VRLLDYNGDYQETARDRDQCACMLHELCHSRLLLTCIPVSPLPNHSCSIRSTQRACVQPTHPGRHLRHRHRPASTGWHRLGSRANNQRASRSQRPAPDLADLPSCDSVLLDLRKRARYLGRHAYLATWKLGLRFARDVAGPVAQARGEVHTAHPGCVSVLWTG
jgi:hypothetical protein